MDSIVDALHELRSSLEGVDLGLPLESAAAASTSRDELLGQIDDYLVPRLARLDAPLLVVFGGSTGSGKSTITNSLVGENVSLAGVLRPSTRTPVLVCNPADRTWFLDGGVLPDLARSTGERPTGSGLSLVTHEQIPAGLGLLDAPDIDSVEIANHELAAQLLGAADAWLFATTASRYADAVPWEYLRRARDRSVAIAVVVNRIPHGATDEVVAHLAEMLTAHRLRDVPIFAIDECAVGDGAAGLDDGRLVPEAIAPIRDWLGSLIADDTTRIDVVRSSVDGVLASIPARVDVITAAATEQAAALDALAAVSTRRFRDALGHLDDELGNGVLLRGEVLDRWREHVGTSVFMEMLQQGVSRVRARLWSLFSGRPIPNEAAQGQLESNLVTLVRSHADRAAVETVAEWESGAVGRAVLAHAERGIDRPTDGLSVRLERELAEWHDMVLQLVQDRAGNKLAVARVLSLGLNGIGVAVMIAVFSQTGGVTGAEAGVAAGTAAIGQTLLTAVFGENAVRDLVRDSRNDLRLRLAGVFEIERNRFDQLARRHAPGADDLDTDVDRVLAAWAAQGRR